MLKRVENNIDKFRCIICNKSYKDKSGLWYHNNKYHLDKNISSGCHNYIPGYVSLFENVRLNVKHILEIGIGSI